MAKDQIYRYADRNMMAYGIDDFEDQISMIEETKKITGDSRLVEVAIMCAQHRGAGVSALYEHGLIVFACKICNTRVGQVEVAQSGRPWGQVDVDRSMN